MRNVQNIVSDTLQQMEWHEAVRETYTTHPDNDQCTVVRVEMTQDPNKYIVFEILHQAVPVVCLLEVSNIRRQNYGRFLNALVTNL